MAAERVLIDVSRLIWRMWRAGPPTGVDRVCLAYVEHFRSNACAVVRRRGRTFVLTPQHSELLFDFFFSSERAFRVKFVKLAPRAFAAARRLPPERGLLYLNVGHTGLDDVSLVRWIDESRVRAIFLVHDLIPLFHPEYCRAGEAARHKRRIETVLKSGHGVIGNSRETIGDLAIFAAAHQLPMPPTVGAWIAGAAIPTTVVPRAFDRPHFVVVGTIEGRKNHALLLQIWKRFVAERGPETPLLVLVGQRGWEASQACAMLDRSLALRGRVLELGSCDDDGLFAIVAGARALLMPSFAEGFGLPVAEALQLGTPVIASNLPVFREFAGDIPTYVDPLDGLGWKAAVTDYAHDSPARRRQLEAVVEYEAPSWRTHFRIVEDWLQALPRI